MRLGNVCESLKRTMDALNAKLKSAGAGSPLARAIQSDMRNVAAQIRECNAGRYAAIPDLESDKLAPMEVSITRRGYYDFRPEDPSPPIPVATPPVKPKNVKGEGVTVEFYREPLISFVNDAPVPVNETEPEVLAPDSIYTFPTRPTVKIAPVQPPETVVR